MHYEVNIVVLVGNHLAHQEIPALI